MLIPRELYFIPVYPPSRAFSTVPAEKECGREGAPVRTLGRMRCPPSPHLRTSVPVGEGLAPPVFGHGIRINEARKPRCRRRGGYQPPTDTHPPHGFAPSRRGGASPSRGLRTTPDFLHHLVGDGVLDVPQIRTQTHGLTAVGADAPGGPFLQPSSMYAGGRGRHHPVGEGLAPPAVYAPRPIFAPSRRGRRPRRPVCPTIIHVRGRPRAAAPTTKTNGFATPRRGRRPRRPADTPPPHGFAPSRRGGACPSRGLRTTPDICTIS